MKIWQGLNSGGVALGVGLFLWACSCAGQEGSSTRGPDGSDSIWFEDSIPSRLECGAEVPATVTFSNDGSTTWGEGPSRWELRAVGASDAFSHEVVIPFPAGRLVEPGEIETFPLELVAPEQLGDYWSEWRLYREDAGLFGETIRQFVRVECQSSLKDDAKTFRVKTPKKIRCGKSQRVSITLVNGGTSTWKREHGFRLQGEGGSAGLLEDEEILIEPGIEVPPGKRHTFKLAFTPPKKSGFWVSRWRMRHGKLAPFGEVVRIPIQVTCSEEESLPPAPPTLPVTADPESTLNDDWNFYIDHDNPFEYQLARCELPATIHLEGVIENDSPTQVLQIPGNDGIWLLDRTGDPAIETGEHRDPHHDTTILPGGKHRSLFTLVVREGVTQEIVAYRGAFRISPSNSRRLDVLPVEGTFRIRPCPEASSAP